MSRTSAENSPSKYYRFAFCDGLEALSARNHNTPFPAHFHPTFNITLVYDGVFNTKLQDRLVLAPSGTILITNPHEIHANPFTRDGNVSFFTFYVSRDFMEYCNNGHPVYFEQKTIDDTRLFMDMHLLSVQLSSNSDFRQLENELRTTFATLATQYGLNRALEDGKKRILFDELLTGDHFEKFSLADAAKSFGIDKYKFLRLFKDETGLTPNNYFIYRRIEQSKAMLAEGKDLLSVAIDLGFYDAAHYANHFKKFTGVSPMNYTSNK